MKNMKKLIFTLLMGLLICNQLEAQNKIFTQETTVLNDYFFPSSDWADIDNDGDKDLVISGALDTDADEFADTSKVDFYENNNGVLSLISQPNVQGLHLGAVKFLDIDYDGDMDLVVSGQNYDDITSYFLTIYENNSGVFTVKQELEGVIYSSIDFGDYDNDGDLDLLITGVGNNGKGTTIYNNTNGTFSDAIANLPGVQGGNAVFGDIDKDEDLDIIINGYDANSDNYAQIFNNVDGIFSAGQIPFATADSWVTLGDYDNDGDLDLVYTGYDANYNYLSKIYNNDGTGMFTDSNIVLKGVGNSSGTTPVAWGDYDNDGDLDLVLSGTDNDFNDLTYLYRNDGTIFTLVEEGLINLGGSTNVTWSDYDNDNDLDILVSGFFDDAAYVSQSVLHKNNIAVVNTQPNVPTNLSNQINTDDSITFTWDNASDDFTPSDGLFYFLTVGTTQNGSEIASYKVNGNSWTIKNLGNTNYYWSVSAVDTAFIISDKATSETLGIENVSNNLSFSVYPNPSNDKKINLNYNTSKLNSDEHNVVIFSTVGKKVLETTLNKVEGFYNKSLDLSSLASGIYILKFISGGFTTTKRIILK
jgi:uncharacterized protein YuzB (UPF0349 family)